MEGQEVKTSVGELCVSLLIASASIGSTAFAIAQMWEWFIVPAFALPVLTLKTAAGVAVLVAILKIRVQEADRKQPDDVDRVVAISAVWFGVGIGWIVQAVL